MFILVQSVTFPADSAHKESEYSVCFERGGKIAKTSDKKCQVHSDGRFIVYFDESITIAATMYKNPQGEFLVSFSFYTN